MVRMKIGKAIWSASVAAIAIPLAPAMAAEDTSSSDVITVTARKVSENVQDVPAAISAFSPTTLKEANITTAKDLQVLTPSLYASQSPVDNTNILFNLRGISSTSGFGESSVATYVDNVYRQLQFGLNGAMFDLERVEVLKGAQGTLYGKNAAAGVINIISKKPQLDAVGGYVRVTGGFYAQHDSDGRGAAQVEGAINLPIVTDKVALRIAGTYDWSAGFGHDAIRQRLNNKDNVALRGHLLFKPSEDWSVLLSGDYSKFSSHGQTYINAEAQPGTLAIALGLMAGYITFPDALPVLTQTGAPGPTFSPGLGQAVVLMSKDFTDNTFYSVNSIARYNDLHTEGGSLTIDGKLGEEVNLRSITAYRHLNRLSGNDLDGTIYTAFNTTTQDLSNFFSQELNLFGKIGQLDWQTGGYYSHFTKDNGSDPRYGSETLTILQGKTIFNDAYEVTNSFGVFARGTLHASDAIDLTGGLRYSQDSRRIRAGDAYYALGTNTIIGCQTTSLPGATVANRCITSFTNHKDSGWSYEFSGNYKVNPDVMVYAATRRGYRAGDFNVAPSYAAYNPETVTDYEIGLKSEFLDRMITFNAAAYLSKYKNIQRTAVVINPATNNTNIVTTNAARADIKGLEFEATIRPGGGFQFGVNYAYTDPKYTEFLEPTSTPGVFKDRSNEVWEVAKHNLGMNVQYKTEIGAGNTFTVRLDGFYRSKVIFGASSPLLATESIMKQDGMFLMNGRMSYRISSINGEVGIFARNITGKKYLTGATSLRAVGSSFVTPGEPRYVGMDFTLNFGG